MDKVITLTFKQFVDACGSATLEIASDPKWDGDPTSTAIVTTLSTLFSLKLYQILFGEEEQKDE